MVVIVNSSFRCPLYEQPLPSKLVVKMQYQLIPLRQLNNASQAFLPGPGLTRLKLDCPDTRHISPGSLSERRRDEDEIIESDGGYSGPGARRPMDSRLKALKGRWMG
jgi:hypothetical protein